MENKKIRIGMIGFGGIARWAHYKGYMRCLEEAEITAVCDIRPEALEAAKETFQLPDTSLFTDYRDLLKSGLVDAVDICTPNYLHCEMAMAAIDAGIPFSVEKPLAMDVKEAVKLMERANETDAPSFICFTWRFKDHVRFVRDMVRSGELGKIYHLNIRCIKDSGLWEGRKLEWRFDKTKAGSGVLGDLGSHMIDVTRFFGEEFDGVYAKRGTYITERQREDSDEIAEVTTDDWCNINGMTKNGVPVTIELSRCATGISQLTEFEFYGEKGSLRYTIEGRDQKIEANLNGNGPQLLVPPVTFEDCQSQSFINMLKGIEDEYTSHLDEGVECQKVLDAALLSSELGRYVTIAEIEAQL